MKPYQTTISGKLIIFILFLLYSCNSNSRKQAEQEVQSFLTTYEQEIAPVESKLNAATFEASISGNADAYIEAAGLGIIRSRIHSNAESFQKLKAFKENKLIRNKLLKRQIDVLYRKLLPNQFPEELQIKLIMIENELQQDFNTYLPVVNGEKLTDRNIEEILANSTDQKQLQQVWEASKMVGSIVYMDVIKVVKLRNKAAKQLGYKNYWELSLLTNEQQPDDIAAIYDELDKLTAEPYQNIKKEIDAYLANRFKIAEKEIMPWHYMNRFAQEPPNIYNIDFNKYYTGKEPVKLVDKFFAGIGLPMHKVLANSDLYEKPGKAQVAFSTAINRNGDVRIIANLKDDYYSMFTLLYETGFSSYLANIDKELPYVLREPAHFFTNDAVATLFSRMASNPAWLNKIVEVSGDEAIKLLETTTKNLRMEKLVFARWAQVMYRFEKAMYENPDQDLNALWWQLVEKYQQIKKPANRNLPDWATKSHLINLPCTYHNYMMGEIYASQLYYYISENVADKNLNCGALCADDPKIGAFLIEKVYFNEQFVFE